MNGAGTGSGSFPIPRPAWIQIEWRENGRRLSRALGHRNWGRAKRKANQFPACFTGPFHGEAPAESKPLTLGTLFDIYREEVTPTKAQRSRRYDRAAMKMFLKFFGRDRKPATLSQRDWDRFIRVRRSDKVGPRRRVHRPNVPLVNLPRLTWSSPVGRNPPGIRASMPPGWIASLRLSTM